MTALVVMVGLLAGAGTGTGTGTEDPFAPCRAAVAARPESLHSYRCYHRVARGDGRLAAPAARHLEGALSLDARHDGARLALAALQADRSRDEAEPLYREAADGFAARGDAEGEVRARVGLSSFLRSRGQREEVAAETERARAVAAGSGDPRLQARVGVLEAWLAYDGGDYGRAGRRLDEIEEGVFAQAAPDLKAAWLSARGIVHWASGEQEQAAASYRRQVEVLRQEGDRYEEAGALSSLSFLSGVLKASREERVARSREVLAVARAGGNRRVEARAHSYLGELSTGSARRAHFVRFLELARESQDARLTVLALRALAMERASAEPDEAFRLMDEAEARAVRVGDLADAARNRVVRARMRWQAGPRPRALADSLAALDAIEATRHLQPDQTVRARRFTQWGGVYSDFVTRILGGDLREPGQAPTPEDMELAFAITERRQAGILVDEMDAAQATPGLRAQGPAVERRAEVLKAIAAVQKRLVAARSEGPRREAQRELERLEREEEASREELARSHPAFAVLRPARLATLTAVREALAEDEALLSFHVGYRVRDPRVRSWVFVQTRENTRVHAVADVQEATLGLFVGLVERRDGSEAAGAVRLYRELLEEPLRDLPPRVNRLVVVMDGVLQQLALDVLRPAPGAEPLGARYQITVVPSATLWLRLRSERRARAEVPALVLADPEFAPVKAAAAEREWALALGARLGRLPQARREGRFIARQLPGSRLLEGREATERFVKQADLKRFGILHVAAHGLIDYDKPDRSAVLLTPGAPEEDGLLQVRELVGLDLKGGVVVLSSCRSATGRPLFEGVMGLPRALFVAGATTVVGSLWPLRDDEAAAIFREFYRSIARGRSVAAALTEARRARLRAGAPAAGWAGLVVLGDGSVVPFPPRASWSGGVWVAAAAVLLVLGLLAVRGTRSARRP